MAGKTKQPTGTVVVTANRLTDGEVVWLAPNNVWSRDIGTATLFPPEAAEAGLAAGLRDEARQIVVAAYVTAAEETDHGPVPLRYRERIRAFGPSVLPPDA